VTGGSKIRDSFTSRKGDVQAFFPGHAGPSGRVPLLFINSVNVFSDREGQMSVLTCNVGDRFVIGNEVVVTVVQVHGDSVTLGLQVPDGMPVKTSSASDKSVRLCNMSSESF
jgi:hypothetical protein